MRISDIANPRQIILITSKAEIDILGKKTDKTNLMAAAWHMPVSFEPMMYAIAVAYERFSYKLIKKSKVFTVNFMPKDLKKNILIAGTETGLHQDKFKKAKLTQEECNKIHCIRIKEALAFLECEVINEVEAGDHVIFIGKVVNYNYKKGKRLFQVAHKKFSTLK